MVQISDPVKMNPFFLRRQKKNVCNSIFSTQNFLEINQNGLKYYSKLKLQFLQA